MRFIELFAGIGGFRYGLIQNNVRLQKSQYQKKNTRCGKNSRVEYISTERLGYTCVWANEIDKYACQIYRKNFGGKELYEGNIRIVRPEDIPEAEMLTAGFPCQAFSIAGKREGFEDTRGTLFYEIARVCRAKRPRYILLENVKGLLSHDKGHTFSTILEVLSDIGYILQWEVLNSKNFGVPQNRERVFIIGHLRGTSRPEVFPIGQGSKNNNKEIAYCLDANYWKGTRDLRKKQRTMVCKYRHSMKGFKGYKNLSVSIKSTEGSGNQIIVNNIRRLTPTECERLQGFPDGWTEGISDTQRYKCLGNAVTTTVIEALGRLISYYFPNKNRIA